MRILELRRECGEHVVAEALQGLQQPLPCVSSASHRPAHLVVLQEQPDARERTGEMPEC